MADNTLNELLRQNAIPPQTRTAPIRVGAQTGGDAEPAFKNSYIRENLSIDISPSGHTGLRGNLRYAEAVSGIALGRGVIQVEPRCLLHMAEAVAAEMFATVPAGDNNQLTRPFGPLQHAQNDHSSATFSII